MPFDRLEDAPSTVSDDDMTWFEPFAEEIQRLHMMSGASPSDMLDLLVWTQGVLMAPRLVGRAPVRPASVLRGSGNRRDRRRIIARSRNRRASVSV